MSAKTASRKLKDAKRLKDGMIKHLDFIDDETAWNASELKMAFDQNGITGFEKHFATLSKEQILGLK